MRPLEGLRVLDFTHAYAGPYCTYLLALAGAEVIKVESPSGDEHRSRPIFEQLNAGKRSVVLDLKTQAGQEAIGRLAQSADVVVENFRPGVAAALRVDADRLRHASKRLIYCSISGFGPDGPMASRPAIEWSVQAATGMSSLYLGADTDPMFNGLSLLDPFSGYFGYSSILSAVLERERTGQGTTLNISMVEGSMILQAARVFDSLREVNEATPPRRPTMARFPAADGSWVFIAALHDKWFAALCQALDDSALAADARFATPAARQDAASDLYALIASRTKAIPAATLVERLTAQGVPAEIVAEFGEFAPQFVREHGLTATTRSREGELLEIFAPSLGSASTVSAPTDVPALGEHTASVLREAGFSEEELERLVPVPHQ